MVKPGVMFWNKFQLTAPTQYQLKSDTVKSESHIQLTFTTQLYILNLSNC